MGYRGNYSSGIGGTMHGFTKNGNIPKLYNVWKNIKYRCYTPSCHMYKDYGGKGVTMYPKWIDNYSNFYKWAIQNGYKEGLTIDRIDSAGNYEPSNCRWITNSENAINRNKK